jgi:hypothetical protein
VAGDVPDSAAARQHAAGFTWWKSAAAHLGAYRVAADATARRRGGP